MKVPPVVLMTGALCLVAAVCGVIVARSARPTESEVIAHGAARYVTETGGKATDCVGIPGEGEVWVIVRCGSGEDARVYHYARNGWSLTVSEGPET